MRHEVAPRRTPLEYRASLEYALERLRDAWWDADVRERSLADIREAMIVLDDHSLPAYLVDPCYADARLLSIAREASAVLEGFAVPLEAAPYSMTVAARRYRSANIAIDEDGYRVSLAAGCPMTRNAFEMHRSGEAACRTTGDDFASDARTLIVGNSTSFGVGASSDATQMASVLNELRPAGRCFNASVKGSNIVQQAIVAAERLPRGADVVIVGGALDLLYALAWPRDDAHGSLPFWNAGDSDLTETACRAIDPARYEDDAAFRAISRALASLAQTARGRGGRALFLVQPHLDLTAKPRTAREARLAVALSSEIGAFKPVHASGALRPHAPHFAPWLASQCREVGIDCLDLNTLEAFTGSDELFLDHIHVNDLGHRRMAEVVLAWQMGRCG